MCVGNNFGQKLEARSEAGFNPCFAGCVSGINEGAMVGQTHACFNPCFAGCVSGILPPLYGIVAVLTGFNPCFAGCVSGIVCFQTVW